MSTTIKSCTNCKWCSCSQYGEEHAPCGKFIPDKLDVPTKKLKPGKYTYDICCKDGKDHLYDSEGNIVFETSNLSELFDFVRENSNGHERTSLFEYTVT